MFDVLTFEMMVFVDHSVDIALAPLVVAPYLHGLAPKGKVIDVGICDQFLLPYPHLREVFESDRNGVLRLLCERLGADGRRRFTTTLYFSLFIQSISISLIRLPTGKWGYFPVGSTALPCGKWVASLWEVPIARQDVICRAIVSLLALNPSGIF